MKVEAQVSNTGIMDTVGGVKINKLSIGGYIDAYMGYTNAAISNKVPYMVSSAQSNEFSINLAYIDVRYADRDFRARFAPGVGTYMNANYQSEPGTLQNIVEASAGFRLFKKKDIWVDAGVLGSPYTNESAISKDHLMYTRSYAPEYVPYYLSGIKFSIPVTQKVNFYTYIINGWQQIRDVNQGKAIGTQVEFRPDHLNLINWNVYIGDERSASAPQNRMRYFTDIYWIHNPDGKFSITSCAYVGNQKRLTGNSSSSHYWWQTNFICRYRLSPKWSISSRLEFFSDPDKVHIIPLNPVINGFSAYSTGICVNIKVREQALLRFEGRYFGSEKSVFMTDSGSPAPNMLWVISNMSVWF